MRKGVKLVSDAELLRSAATVLELGWEQAAKELGLSESGLVQRMRLAVDRGLLVRQPPRQPPASPKQTQERPQQKSKAATAVTVSTRIAERYAKERSEEALDELVNHLLPWIRRVASVQARRCRSCDADEVLSETLLATLRLLPKWNPETAKIHTYLAGRLRFIAADLDRANGGRGEGVRARRAEELRRQKSRRLSTAELEQCGTRRQRPRLVSIDGWSAAPYGCKSNADVVEDWLGRHDPPNPLFSLDELRRLVRPLPFQEQVLAYLLLVSGLNLAEAAQLLGVVDSRVSQKWKAALKILAADETARAEARLLGILPKTS